MKTLIIAAHLDDKSISCGGKPVAEGHEVHVRVLFGRTYEYGKSNRRMDPEVEACGSISFLSLVSSRSRSSWLSLTPYFFTAICFAVTMRLRRYGVIDSETLHKIKDVEYLV